MSDDFDHMPEHIAERLKILGFREKADYIGFKRKSTFGLRFMGDFEQSDGSNTVDGMMVGVGRNTIHQALLDALDVQISQSIMNTSMATVKYIMDLFKPPHSENGTPMKEWERTMEDVLSSPERMVVFLEVLLKTMQEGMLGDFIDKVFENEPRVIMVGDSESVASAIGRTDLPDDMKLTDKDLQDLLKEAVKSEEE
tara:strand:- start:270 stop:860 length:591 start_codon:yes stop_codon:yes gene_type:complete